MKWRIASLLIEVEPQETEADLERGQRGQLPPQEFPNHLKNIFFKDIIDIFFYHCLLKTVNKKQIIFLPTQ